MSSERSKEAPHVVGESLVVGLGLLTFKPLGQFDVGGTARLRQRVLAVFSAHLLHVPGGLVVEDQQFGSVGHVSRWLDKVAPLNLGVSAVRFKNVAHTSVVLRDLLAAHVVLNRGGASLLQFIDDDLLFHDDVHRDFVGSVAKLLAFLDRHDGVHAPRANTTVHEHVTLEVLSGEHARNRGTAHDGLRPVFERDILRIVNNFLASIDRGCSHDRTTALTVLAASSQLSGHVFEKWLVVDNSRFLTDAVDKPVQLILLPEVPDVAGGEVRPAVTDPLGHGEALLRFPDGNSTDINCTSRNT